MQYHHRETIKSTRYDGTKRRAHDTQVVRAKENLKLSYGGPSQRQASGTNQRIKALRHGRHQNQISKGQRGFAISRGFYFCETPHPRSLAKIKPSRKFPNLLLYSCVKPDGRIHYTTKSKNSYKLYMLHIHFNTV